MQVLKKFSKTLLTASESLSMAERCIMALLGVSDAFVAAVVDEVKSNIAVVRSALGREDGNPLTDQIAVVDGKRDMAFKAFRAYITAAASRIAKPEFVSAGTALTELLRQAGWRLYDEGYANQTAQTAVLVEKLSSPEAIAALETIGAKEWLDEFIGFDTQFNELYARRARELGNQQVPLLREAKANLDQSLDTLCMVVDMRAANDPQQYKEAVSALNEIITELMSIARARETRQSDSDGGESGEAATSSHMQ